MAKTIMAYILKDEVQPKFPLGANVLIGFPNCACLGSGKVIGYNIEYDEKTEKVSIKYVVKKYNDTIICSLNEGFKLFESENNQYTILVQKRHVGYVSLFDHDKVVKELY